MFSEHMSNHHDSSTFECVMIIGAQCFGEDIGEIAAFIQYSKAAVVKD